MKSVRRLLLVLMWATLAGCGGSDSPSSPAPGPGGGDTITGNERIGWNQTAGSPAELGGYRYAIYVDGARSEVADASCTASGSGTYACSGRLPTMPAGSHVIELATFVLDGSTIIESPRSAPLNVTVRAASAEAAGPAARTPPSTVSTGDGITFDLLAVAQDLDRPSDLAIAADGRLFVAEAAGRIRILGDPVPGPPAAVLEDVVDPGGGGLLALALDPDFDRSHFVYALYTAAGREGGLTFRLARWRESAGTLGQRAVLLDGVPAAPGTPSGTIRFGPDGRLYVALDDGGDPDSVGRLASYNGKVLRLNSDGTTPDDQPAASPVHAAGVSSPGGLDWDPDTGLLWIVGSNAGAHLAAVFGTADDRANAMATTSLPPGAERTPRAAVFHRGAGVPVLTGDLLVAGGTALLRLSLAGRAHQRVASIERLLEDQVDGVRAVAVGGDGAIHVATASAVLTLRSR